MKNLLLILVILTLFTSCSKDVDEAENINSAPNMFSVNIVHFSSTNVLVSWDSAIDPDGDLVKYSVVINNQVVVDNLLITEYELIDLTPSTSHNGKIVAIDSKNNSTESVFNFITASVPNVQTFEVSDLNLFSFNAGGKLIDQGSSEVSEVGLVIGTYSSPTIEGNLDRIELNLDDQNEFNITIISSPANTTFYMRAYGINNDGVGYGNEVQFTTPNENVYNGDITLSTQEEVVEFGANNYTTINGRMYINGTVSDLSPLLSIVVVNSLFEVKNTTNLQNFDGLNNLRVTGNIEPNGFIIEGNVALENFSGLNSLEVTRGETKVINNDNLLNFQGLDSYVVASAGEFRVQDCDGLLNLSGLENFTFVGSDFYLVNNSQLNDISAVSNINHVGSRIHVENNSSLESINGFQSLTSIEGIEIYNNDILTNLDGLGNLVSIETISIKYNDNLTNLSAFQNISTTEFLSIEDNSSLTSLAGFNNLSSIGEQLYIYNNSNLISLEGLENLSFLERLYIHSNNSLINLSGLSGLTNIYGSSYPITIGFNSNLNSLSGFENLTYVSGYIQIFNNSQLNDFCALSPLFADGNHQGDLSIESNLSNPSIEEIVNNCN